MKIRKNHLRSGKVVSLLLSMAVAVSCLSFDAFAGKDDPAAASYRFEDGRQASIDAMKEAGSIHPVDLTGDYEGYQERQSNDILSTPLTTRVLEVYSTYMFFNPMMLYEYGIGSLNGYYLGYSKDNGANWEVYQYGNYDPIPYWQNVTVAGLTPNKDYIVRLLSGSGDYLTDFKVHTGMKDTPVKSITVQAINVKKHRVRDRTPYLGLPLHTFHTEYSFRLKITVTMKRKPGAKGIYLNGAWMGGNKKKYTKIISHPRTYKNPRGKRYSVSVYSGFDSSYGGFSPLKKKTVRIK